MNVLKSKIDILVYDDYQDLYDRNLYRIETPPARGPILSGFPTAKSVQPSY